MLFFIYTYYDAELLITFLLYRFEDIIVFVLTADNGFDPAHPDKILKLFHLELLVKRNYDSDAASNGKI